MLAISTPLVRCIAQKRLWKRAQLTPAADALLQHHDAASAAAAQPITYIDKLDDMTRRRARLMQDLVPDGATVAKLSLTWLPLAASLIALYFAAQTYYLAYRPYVGIVEQDYRIEQDPGGEPTEMVWRFVMKNTGTSPAAVTLSKNVSTLTRGGQSTTLPVIGGEPGSMIMMPGQIADITGKFSNAGGVARVREVLDGAVVLRVDIQLKYRTLGSRWWNRSFNFEVLNRFRHDYPRPVFIMERWSAN